MPLAAGRSLVDMGQVAIKSSNGGDEFTELDHATTLKALSGKNGYQWRWYAQPSMPELRSDLNAPQSTPTRDSDASTSTWSSSVSSYFGSRVASTATSPPTSADYANMFRMHRTPTPPSVSRFSADLIVSAQSCLPDGNVQNSAYQMYRVCNLVQEKVKSIPFHKLFPHNWGKLAKAADLENNYVVRVKEDFAPARGALLSLTAEDRFAMAILAAKDVNQHALFDDASQPHSTSASYREPSQDGLLAALTPIQVSFGDTFPQDSPSPRQSRQRASYQSIQSTASLDSNLAGTRSSDTRPDPYLCGISIFLPGSKGTRWVDTRGDFDSRSNNCHISPAQLRELGIDIALDLAVSRALQRLGIQIPRDVVGPTSYSAVGSSGDSVPAQGKITLTWKAHMGEDYHTYVFFAGPENAPYQVLIGMDYLVPTLGEPRMKLCLVNYRNHKNEEERREMNRARRRQENDVAENERDKQLYATSQQFSRAPLAGYSMQQPQSLPPGPLHQLPVPIQQPLAYQWVGPQVSPMYHQVQYPPTPTQTSSRFQYSSPQPLQPLYQQTPQQQPHASFATPPWAQHQPSPQSYTPSTRLPAEPTPPRTNTPSAAYYPPSQQSTAGPQRQLYTRPSYPPSAPQYPYSGSGSQQDASNPNSGSWI